MKREQRTGKCAWCGTTFAIGGTVGRPPKYCKRSHRQRAFEASKRGAKRGLGGGEVLLDEAGWSGLKDALYRLEAAVEDAEMDLADGVDAAVVAQTLVRCSSQAVASLPEPKATSGTTTDPSQG